MSTSERPVHLLTCARIAELLGQSPQRVATLIRRAQIEPVACAGRTLVYDRQSLARIRYELNLADARRDAEAKPCR